MIRMTKRWWLYLTAAVLTLAAGCGGPAQQEEDDTGSAQLFGTMTQAITSADVTSVRVTVSAADMQPRTADLVKTHNPWSGTLGKLPAGTDRTFTAEAFNSGGSKLYAGVATGVTIVTRQATAVSITLQEVNPAAPFENAAPVVTSLSAAPGNVEAGGTCRSRSGAPFRIGAERGTRAPRPSGALCAGPCTAAHKSVAKVPETTTVAGNPASSPSRHGTSSEPRLPDDPVAERAGISGGGARAPG